MVANSSDILPLMIGTAGHVDHGKTSLVKALTEIDTDTLKEERERGMSIDFGVAPCALPSGKTAGIIDVPGHRSFIRNMVAGASSIDVMMLVVAADDSLMPQTVEHMRIARMLGMSRLIVVISKIDLVDAETLEIVEQEVREFLDALEFKEYSLLKLSSKTGEGVDRLRTTLDEVASELPKRVEKSVFRMYVRKAFTMKGYGTVVTGVPQSGKISVGEKLELLPSGKSSAVRGLQNYRNKVEAAVAHVSTAMNLRDLAPEELERGMALCTPGAFAAVRYVLVSFKNDSDIELKKKRGRLQLRLHVGTVAALVNVRVLGASVLAPGSRGFLVLGFHSPQVCALGDRFILRTLSPGVTLGGGIVLALRQVAPKERSKASRARFEQALKAFEKAELGRSLLLSAKEPVSKISLIAKQLHTTSDEVLESFKLPIKRGELNLIGEDYAIDSSRVAELGGALEQKLVQYHTQNPLSLGMREELVCELLDLPSKHFGALWQVLQGDSRLSYHNKHLSLKSFSPQVNEKLLEVSEEILSRVKVAGVQSLARGPLQQELGVNDKDWRKITKLLVDRGELVVLGANLLPKGLVDEFESKLLELFSKKEVVELKEFREAIGASRNIAVGLLEHFDVKGLTKRSGSGRILVQKSK